MNNPGANVFLSHSKTCVSHICANWYRPIRGDRTSCDRSVGDGCISCRVDCPTTIHSPVTRGAYSEVAPSHHRPVVSVLIDDARPMGSNSCKGDASSSGTNENGSGFRRRDSQLSCKGNGPPVFVVVVVRLNTVHTLINCTLTTYQTGLDSGDDGRVRGPTQTQWKAPQKRLDFITVARRLRHSPFVSGRR
uniref:Uncharacterized protein n=1 Tax=Plectus sambesii TaxID=2011161 RepID=A0A914X1S6_9BILA